jgi:hypothetical protein
MTVFMLKFCEGQYDCYNEYLLGIFSSREKLDEALVRYQAAKNSYGKPSFVEGGDQCGEYVVDEIELDEVKSDEYLSCCGRSW